MMKLTGRFRQLGALAAVVALVATGCGDGVDDEAAAPSDSDATDAPDESEDGDTQDDACDVDGDAPGISDDTIKLGTFTPLSGPVAAPGQGAVDGQQVVFDRVNADGGIDGRMIEFTAVDDEYDASVAQQAVRRLVQQEEIFAISGSIGTPNFVAALPFIDQEQIPAIGPYAPSNQIGTMDNPMVYMIWPNFIDEYLVMTDYIISEEGAENIAMLVMTGDVGDDALQGVEEAMAAYDMELVAQVSTEATTTDYSSIALELQNTDADWVLTIVQPTGTGQAIEAMQQIGYTPRIGTQSDMTDGGWISAFPEAAEGLIAPTKVAPLSSDEPLMEAFRTEFTEATGEEPTMWNAVGYAQALITVEALESAPALTRDCLEYALQTMDGFETGIIPPVTFGPDERQGTKAVGLAEIRDGVVQELAPFVPLPE